MPRRDSRGTAPPGDRGWAPAALAALAARGVRCPQSHWHRAESMSEQEQLAPMKAQVYRDPRPKEFFDRFHERARTKDPNWAYEAVRITTALYSLGFFRARVISAEKVPPSGPVILAPNHFSFLDHFFVAAFIRREVNFMAKSQLFKPPLQVVYTHGGVLPVLRRGGRDEEAFKTARADAGARRRGS